MRTRPTGDSFPHPLSCHSLCSVLSRSWRLEAEPRDGASAGDGAPPATACSHRRGSCAALPHLPFLLSLPGNTRRSTRRCGGTEDDGGGWSALCPRRGLPFGRGGGVLLHCHVLHPVPRHADAHRIERNGAATVAALFAGGPVSFFCFSSVIFFGDRVLWG
jgi:hypothetical protein